jgi:hypothetical protein
MPITCTGKINIDPIGNLYIDLLPTKNPEEVATFLDKNKGKDVQIILTTADELLLANTKKESVEWSGKMKATSDTLLLDGKKE